MKRFLMILFCIYLITGCGDSEVNKVSEKESEKLSINIDVEETVINVNEIPKLTVKVTNESDENIVLYLNSEHKYFPSVSLKFTSVETGFTQEDKGVVNYGYPYKLVQDSFLNIAPKKSLLLCENSEQFLEKYSNLFSNIGEYKLQLIIAYTDDPLIKWPDGEDSQLKEMFNKIPKESFVSNEITINIE